MSRNIRSLCNTTLSNERYVPITGYRRHILIHSVTTDLTSKLAIILLFILCWDVTKKTFNIKTSHYFVIYV